MRFACRDCGSAYPDQGLPYHCPECGGVYDFAQTLRWNGENASRQGLARFEVTLGSEYCGISLGEGNTPLVAADVHGLPVYFKCEYSNPTGSFKDRGAAALVSFLVSRSVKDSIEDSSGNAGSAFAAYAARAGVRGTVFVPQSASGRKRRQIEAYGGQLMGVPGPRSQAALAARRAADGGAVYASHAYLPQQLLGYTTLAFEIHRQLGLPPGCVVVPVGQGGLLLGLSRGFAALASAGIIGPVPMLIGVQSLACAPLAAGFDPSVARRNGFGNGQTVAEGVRVTAPLRLREVVAAVRETSGQILAAPEDAVLGGRDALSRLGFYVEPTSALVWYAIDTLLPELPRPVVLVLTGSGYKAAAR
jgi:threonine synthase